MLGAQRLSDFAKTLARGEPPMRRQCLFDLEALGCAGEVSPLEKKLIGAVVIANYHLRPLSERRVIARFLDIWFESEVSRRLSRKFLAAHLEEIDPEARESLRVAAVTTMPCAELIRHLASPPREDLTEGLGLLVLVETAFTRLRTGEFPFREIPDLIRALRAARSHRASHVAKPFLWRLEVVLEIAQGVAGVAAKGER